MLFNSYLSLQVRAEEETSPAVINFVSSVDQPITWGEFMSLNARAVQIPSVKCIWYYEFRLIKSTYLYLFYVALLHLLPAFLVDTGCRLVGKKPL